MIQAGLAVKAEAIGTDFEQMRTKGIRLGSDHKMLSPGGQAGLNP